MKTFHSSNTTNNRPFDMSTIPLGWKLKEPYPRRPKVGDYFLEYSGHDLQGQVPSTFRYHYSPTLCDKRTEMMLSGRKDIFNSNRRFIVERE